MKKQHYSEILQEKIDKRNLLLIELSEELTNTLSYLSSSKFQGFENNFVNAQEMASRIIEIRNMIYNDVKF
jgi:hypothetical protein